MKDKNLGLHQKRCIYSYRLKIIEKVNCCSFMFDVEMYVMVFLGKIIRTK